MGGVVWVGVDGGGVSGEQLLGGVVGIALEVVPEVEVDGVGGRNGGD